MTKPTLRQAMITSDINSKTRRLKEIDSEIVDLRILQRKYRKQIKKLEKVI